jgi:RNA polymerase sigma-70 factor, ECF subfamily
MNEESDAALLDRARTGDEPAFRALYERHRDGVFRFAYRLLGSETLAEDATHDCFIGLLRRPQGFEPARASLRTYLCAAARHLAFQQLRKRGVLVDLEEAGDMLAVTSDGPLDRLLADETAARVAAAVARLPPLQREALVLFEYEEMTLAEVAEVAGVNSATVSARLQRARAHLRAWLSDAIEEPATGAVQGRWQ